jgi:hypothetical protein
VQPEIHTNETSTTQPSTSINNAQATRYNNSFSDIDIEIDFNDITTGQDFYPVKYFATNKLTTSNYRLELYKPIVTPDKILARKITIKSDHVEALSATEMPASSPIKLGKEQLLGTAELELYHDKWISLPGISYHDQCIGISHTDLIDLYILNFKIRVFYL